MPTTLWTEQAAALAPLLRHARPDDAGGICPVLEYIAPLLPRSAGLGVFVGPAAVGQCIGQCFDKLGWRALRLDACGSAPPSKDEAATASAGDLPGLLAAGDVPQEFECLVIGLHGQDYWAWESLAQGHRPSLVAVAFNPHAALAIEATVERGSSSFPPRDKNFGATYAALCGLARRSGYRLIHVHGPALLFFLRAETPFPAELTVKAEMSPAEWSVLLDCARFHQELQGQAPAWLSAAEPDVSRSPWEILAPAMASKPVNIEGLVLEVADKYDATWYQQRKTFEEKASLLYQFLRDEEFANFLDVGANVGLISILARKANAGLKVIAVEADPRLLRMIRQNFAQHGLADAHVVNAAAGSHDKGSATFSLNPGSTLDNRVQVASWRKVRVPMRRMDSLLETLEITGKTFIKIDTQGFELQVLTGLERFLGSQPDWVLKMEFAPDWLRSQGSDPRDVLQLLQSRYEFAEYPERITFGTPGLEALFTHPIAPSQHDEFLTHVAAQNRNGLGWVDLIVRPRGKA